MAETTETRWFKWICFISTGFITGALLANVIYFDRIYRSAVPNPSVPKGNALAMVWINGILFVVALILFIWSLVRILTTKGVRGDVTKYFQQEGGGYYGTQAEFSGGLASRQVPYFYPGMATA